MNTKALPPVLGPVHLDRSLSGRSSWARARRMALCGFLALCGLASTAQADLAPPRPAGQTQIPIATLAAAQRAEQVRQASVIVVAGSADHMDQVLRKAGAKFVTVQAEELIQLPLHSQQVLMVNCRGTMSAAAADRVRRFVKAGGFLYTTDHAVGELVEKIFPDTIAWNHVTTQQQVFPMQVYGDKGARGLLRHLGESASQKWQLAGGGYLIKVLDPHRVETLMESKEVAARYGSGILGVRFKYEDGYVIHVTGHFYTQPGQDPAIAGRGGDAGTAFQQLSENVVSEKAADKSRIDGLYNSAPRSAVMLQAAPAPSAPAVAKETVTTQELNTKSRVRMLEKKGSYVKVRDEQGNEGWAPASAF